MQRRSYKLVAEALGISDKHETPTIVTIPEGSRVTIAGSRNRSRLIEVLWEGETIMMFAQDLDEGGILEHEASASP